MRALSAAFLSLLLLSGCVRYAPPPQRPAPTASENLPAEEPIAPSAPSITSRPLTEPFILPAAPPPPVMPPQPRMPTVGLLLPLSGPQSALGKSMFNAAQMALFEGGGNIALRPYDSRETASGALEALANAKKGGAKLILGPVFAAQTARLGPVSTASKIPVLSFSNDRGVAGNSVYVMGLHPEPQVERVVRYASSQGTRRFAGLFSADAYGDALQKAMREAVAKSGGTVLASTTATNASESLKTAITTLSAQLPQRSTPGSAVTVPLAPIQAVFIGLSGGTLRSALAVLASNPALDLSKVRLLGTSAWTHPDSLKEPLLQGAWLAAPSEAGRKDFVNRYQAAYKDAPAPLASLAYDAAALAVALERSNQDFSPATLENPAGFAGVDGVFRFLKNGQIQRGFAVWTVENKTFKEISPAPAQFYGF